MAQNTLPALFTLAEYTIGIIIIIFHQSRWTWMQVIVRNDSGRTEGQVLIQTGLALVSPVSLAVCLTLSFSASSLTAWMKEKFHRVVQ